MEYEIFIFINMKKKDFANVLYDIVRKIVKGKVELREYEGYAIDIGCEKFTLSVEIEDISNIPLVNKEYCIKTNICVSLQVYSDDKVQSISPLLEILAKSMTVFKDEILVLKNGTIVLLVRKNNRVIVNSNLDRKYLDMYQIDYSIDDKIK